VAEGAASLAALAQPGEVLVSRIVADLVDTSRFGFVDRGRQELGSGEGSQPFFSVR
jgi:hypothetical protein